MRALQLVGPERIEVRDVPVPEPGPGEVLVRVGGAGLCHSDLHLLHLGLEVPPFTLGHETAGWVAASGPGATGLEEGLPVIVHGAWGCGTCADCLAGEDQHCLVRAGEGVLGSGLFRDGGLAEYLLVPAARYVVPLEGLEPRDAAPLDDAALTPYRVIKRALPGLAPGSVAAVVGVGGLGHMAVQLLRELTAARVVAIDVDEGKLDLARELGADEAIAAGDPSETTRRVGEVTGGRGAALVLDCVGADETLAAARAVVAPRGGVAVVGVGGGTLPVTFGALPPEASVWTAFWGSVTDLREVLALARSGRIGVRTTHVTLDEAPEAYRRMDEGRLGTGRAVVAFDP